ncbi:MAG: outer membrane beta-barrel domain-containing protein [Deltaproteobacteria bacterium]|nr:outer membrane beta-barrel domain-containing protein [Deltaproteobacteria bacterium]
MRTTPVAVLVLVAVLLAPLCATADVAELPPVVQKRLHPLAGRHEITPFFTASVFDAYSSYMGGGLGYSYHIFDLLSVRAKGFYAAGSDVKYKVDQKTEDERTLYPPEVTRMTFNYYAGGDLVFHPVYGKLSLVSSAAVNYGFYMFGGAGYMGTAVKNPVDGTSKGGGTIGGNLGGGLQIFALKWLTLNVEISDLMYSVSSTSKDITTIYETKTGPEGGPLTVVKPGEVADSKFNNNIFVNVGVGFLL